MAARLFSKDPLSWGQMFFVWVGGLLVVALPLIAAVLSWDEGDNALRQAGRLESRAERLFEGFPEFGLLPTPPAVRLFTLRDLPSVGPTTGSPTVDSDGEVLEEPSAASDPVERELRRLLIEEEQRKLTDSMAVDRMEEARSERGAARLWFGGAIALFLVAAGGVGFLVWRSYHGAARA